MGRTKLDERGRILIPLEERQKLGLKTGTEIELVSDDGALILKPIIPEPIQVDATTRKWGREAFLDAGEATFGEQ
jgi:AbrB family looped-hinge helix DNA binding protein